MIKLNEAVSADELGAVNPPMKLTTIELPADIAKFTLKVKVYDETVQVTDFVEEPIKMLHEGLVEFNAVPDGATITITPPELIAVTKLPVKVKVALVEPTYEGEQEAYNDNVLVSKYK